jgi:hypothetical protein
VHEGHPPDLLGDLSDSDILPGERATQVDLATTDAQPSATRHRGFIVCRIGFQAGARAAVEKTNIDLVTFQELQAIFFDRWRISMAKRFRPFADRLFPYWDFPGKKPSIPWTKTHSQINDRLTEAYRLCCYWARGSSCRAAFGISQLTFQHSMLTAV